MCRPLAGARAIFQNSFFGARLAQRVADRSGGVLAFAVLGDLRIAHGRAVLALQLLALVPGQHPIGNADQTQRRVIRRGDAEAQRIAQGGCDKL